MSFMRSRFSFITRTFLLVAALAASAAAQDDRILPKPSDPREQPEHVREMIAKLQSDQLKKEHDMMLRRGEDALKLIGEIEQAVSAAGSVSRDSREKLDELEKLVKKIRDDLNGDEDDEGEASRFEPPATTAECYKALYDLVDALNEELKKTSRFAISARAIDRTNSVLRMIRHVRALR
jgi:hypothetical protein